MPKPNNLTHCILEKPPTCLHILGQGLVNAMYAEARALLLYCEELERALDLSIPQPESGPESRIPSPYTQCLLDNHELIERFKREEETARVQLMEAINCLVSASSNEEIAHYTQSVKDTAATKTELEEKHAAQFTEWLKKYQ